MDGDVRKLPIDGAKIYLQQAIENNGEWNNCYDSKSVADSVESLRKYNIIGYTDIKEDTACKRYRYLGSDDMLRDIYDGGVRYGVKILSGTERTYAAKSN